MNIQSFLDQIQILKYGIVGQYIKTRLINFIKTGLRAGGRRSDNLIVIGSRQEQFPRFFDRLADFLNRASGIYASLIPVLSTTFQEIFQIF